MTNAVEWAQARVENKERELSLRARREAIDALGDIVRALNGASCFEEEERACAKVIFVWFLTMKMIWILRADARLMKKKVECEDIVVGGLMWIERRGLYWLLIWQLKYTH